MEMQPVPAAYLQADTFKNGQTVADEVRNSWRIAERELMLSLVTKCRALPCTCE